jgi:hypothetical protein
MMNVNTAEIKNSLHRLIVETDDEFVLNKVQAYFATLTSQSLDWWDTISDQEKESINIGLRQFKNGEGIPHADVKQKVDKLLGRK